MKKATILFLSMLFSIIMLTGCSSLSLNAASSTGNSSNSVGESKNNAVGNSGSNDINSGTSGQQDNRKVEKSATLTVETLTYDNTNAMIEALTVQYGGYIESSTVDGQSLGDLKHSRTAQYILRIPQEKLDSFLGGAFTSGTVTQKTVTGVDVSQQYYDTQARLTALQTQQNSLLDMLKKATNTDDMIKINQSLTDVITQIEQLTSKLQQIDSLVKMSTVRVTVKEVTESTKTDTSKDFGTQLWNTFNGSLNAFANYCKIMVLLIVAILPFAVFFGIVAAAVIMIVRRQAKKRKNPTAFPKIQYSQQIAQQNTVKDNGDNKPK